MCANHTCTRRLHSTHHSPAHHNIHHILDDCPADDNHVADGPVADSLVVDSPADGGPVADGPADDSPVADSLAGDGPAADGPAGNDGPVTDQHLGVWVVGPHPSVLQY